MEELFKAIYLFWNSDACTASRELAKGGLWMDTAEERTVKPYGTYVIGLTQTEFATRSIIETTPVTFTFYSDDSETRKALQIVDAFCLAFDAFDVSDAARGLVAPSGFTATVTQADRRGRTGPLRMTEKVYACECNYEFVVVTTKN